jgi:hypothetical protein
VPFACLEAVSCGPHRVQQTPLSQRVAYLESRNFSEKVGVLRMRACRSSPASERLPRGRLQDIAVALHMAENAARKGAAMEMGQTVGPYGSEQVRRSGYPPDEMPSHAHKPLVLACCVDTTAFMSCRVRGRDRECMRT